MSPAGDLLREIERRVGGESPPAPAELAADMEAVCEVLETEPAERRPRDDGGLPGGIVHLQQDLPTVVLPDIHGRIDLLVRVMAATFPDHGISEPFLQALDEGRAQLVMLGDYVHGEARARSRWSTAYREFQEGYRVHEAIDEEMYESLTVLQIVSLLKQTYPDRVHGLKGNHENIANEEGRGNHPFGKFAAEGAMIAEYMERFYPGNPFDAVYRFEHDLPILAVGGTFLVTHAEPLQPYTHNDILNYRENPHVVEGLTWTDNDAAEDGGVEQMIGEFLPNIEAEDAIHLGGHRPVAGLYALRAGGRYVQFHNPGRSIVAIPPGDRPFSPDTDVVEL